MSPLYAARLANALRGHYAVVREVALPDGEAHKDWACLNQIFDALLGAGCDRKTVLFALGGGVVGDAMGLGAGVALGQVMAQQLQGGLAGAAPGVAAAAAQAAQAAGIKPDEVMATLEKLADLKAKGLLTEDEFAAKKAELLKKLV